MKIEFVLQILIKLFNCCLQNIDYDPTLMKFFLANKTQAKARGVNCEGFCQETYNWKQQLNQAHSKYVIRTTWNPFVYVYFLPELACEKM